MRSLLHGITFIYLLRESLYLVPSSCFMSRIFTINFRFREQPVTALVNLRGAGCERTCIVRYLDQEIATLMPNGTLAFSLGNSQKPPGKLAGRPQEELYYRTSEAITRHLGQS